VFGGKLITVCPVNRGPAELDASSGWADVTGRGMQHALVGATEGTFDGGCWAVGEQLLDLELPVGKGLLEDAKKRQHLVTSCHRPGWLSVVK